MKALYIARFSEIEDTNLHGCYTPKTARCWRNRQYFPPKCLYLLGTGSYHPTRLQSSSTPLSEPDNSYFP